MIGSDHVAKLLWLGDLKALPSVVRLSVDVRSDADWTIFVVWCVSHLMRVRSGLSLQSIFDAHREANLRRVALIIGLFNLNRIRDFLDFNLSVLATTRPLFWSFRFRPSGLLLYRMTRSPVDLKLTLFRPHMPDPFIMKSTTQGGLRNLEYCSIPPQ